MDYHSKINNILNASGLSQEALAAKLGVSFVTLNSWLNQKSAPTRRSSLEKIDKLYVTYFGQIASWTCNLSKPWRIGLPICDPTTYENRPVSTVVFG